MQLLDVESREWEYHHMAQYGPCKFEKSFPKSRNLYYAFDQCSVDGQAQIIPFNQCPMEGHYDFNQHGIHMTRLTKYILILYKNSRHAWNSHHLNIVFYPINLLMLSIYLHDAPMIYPSDCFGYQTPLRTTPHLDSNTQSILILFP